jgi:hypothetical protein
MRLDVDPGRRTRPGEPSLLTKMGRVVRPRLSGSEGGTTDKEHVRDAAGLAGHAQRLEQHGPIGDGLATLDRLSPAMCQFKVAIRGERAEVPGQNLVELGAECGRCELLRRRRGADEEHAQARRVGEFAGRRRPAHPDGVEADLLKQIQGLTLPLNDSWNRGTFDVCGRTDRRRIRSR